LTTFGGLIIKGLGFSGINASLLSMPTGVMSTLAAFIFSLGAAKWNNRRCLVTIIACIVPIIGAAIVYALPRTNLGGQMVGLYLLYTYFGPYVVGKYSPLPLFAQASLTSRKVFLLHRPTPLGTPKRPSSSPSYISAMQSGI